jgi:hypothetical protein
VSYTGTKSPPAIEVIVALAVNPAFVTSAFVDTVSSFVPSVATSLPSTVPTSVVIFLLPSMTSVPPTLTAIFVLL